MSSLVASWSSIIGKIGIGNSYNSFYCPSMSQILSYSSKIAICGSNDISFVKGYYSNNQLVELSDISYKSSGGGEDPEDPQTQKTYKIIGNISFGGSINNISWKLSDSSNIQLSIGGLSSNGYFEISYTGVSAPYYLEIIIVSNDYNYVNENRNTSLSFTSSNICNLGTVTFETL